MADWDPRVNEIFLNALEKHGAQREAYLDTACGNDAELRRAALEMLTAHEQAGSFFDRPVTPPNYSTVVCVDPPGDMDARPTPQQGERRRYDFLAPAQEPDELGRLGSYRVLQLLGEGGMGLVFLAEDRDLKRRVALKVMKKVDDDAHRRFLREAQAMAALEHEHIISIYQVGQDRGTPFIAMQLLRGQTLEQLLAANAPLLPEQIVRIGREVAEGLDAAHAKGLIHRDVKPTNIWIEADRGRVKLLDFGLARAVNPEVKVTTDDSRIGTPSFMAPEQARGAPIDHRCDLFSLGCVLYWMATQTLPFPGENTLSVLHALANLEPPAPHIVNPCIPKSLSRLIMYLLSKKPEDRPKSAAEVARALADLDGESATPKDRAMPAAMTPASAMPSRRIRTAAIVAVVAFAGFAIIAVLALGGLWHFWSNSGSQPTPDSPQVKPVVAGPPFVVLPRNDKQESAFATLAEAVNHAQSGDAIEIRGDGPFFMEELVLDAKKSLAIRAGKGCRPVLELRHADKIPPGSLLNAQSPLILEGLELRYFPADMNLPVPNLVLTDAELHMAHCRLINGLGHVLTGTNWRDSEIVHCEFLGGPGWACLSSCYADGPGRLRVDNCILASRDGQCIQMEIEEKLEENTLDVRNCTVCSNNVIFFVTACDPDLFDKIETEKSRVHVQCSRNFMMAPVGLAVFEWNSPKKLDAPLIDSAKALLKRQWTWHDENNWYEIAGAFCYFDLKAASDWKPVLEAHTDWHRFWNQMKGSGSLGKNQFAGGDVFQKMARSVAAVIPNDFQLTPDSAAAKAGRDGANPGADVDRVGPGPPYEAWKKTAAYRDWVKMTGR